MAENLPIYQGSGGGGCFPAGTLVHTPSGQRPIEELRSGDLVVAFDPKGELHEAKVLLQHWHARHEVWRYWYWGGWIDATPNHWFWLDGAFQEIGKLERDAPLCDRQGLLRPLERSVKLGDFPVYNLTIADYHTFLVGEHGLRCHNGGSGKSSSSPTEDQDSARSSAYGIVTELLSEGPVEGLVNRAQSIYLDRTPVRNEDSSSNFKDFSYLFRKGLPEQKISSSRLGDEIATETAVGVDITKEGGPITRSFVNPEVDRVRVRVGLQLQEFEEDGDVTGEPMEFVIYTQRGSEGFVQRTRESFNAKFSSITEFEYEFRTSNQGGTQDTWAIRIERLTNDSDNQREQRVLRWQSFTEVVENKLNYPYSAIATLQFAGEQFDSIPERAYRLRGLRVRVPSNTVVDDDGGLTFSGLWDGSFYRPSRACSDPAWQVYEFLTNRRFGLGRKLSDARVFAMDLYQISQHNNELISDGQGGTERRYRCDTVIQSRQNALDLIDALLSSCHAKRYWAGGTMRFWQDRPTETLHQFTQADVESGKFAYSSTALRSRFTRCLIAWNDPTRFYEQEIEPYEDQAAVNRYGYQQTELSAFGCASRASAIRFGRWAIYSSQNEVETVTFTARGYSIFVKPGDVIAVHDPNRAGRRWGGLVASASTSQVELDFGVELLGGSRVLICYLPDGTLQQRGIASYDPQTKIVTLGTPFTQAPNPESPWIISSDALGPSLWRVLSVKPQPDPTKTEITALAYRPEKYGVIEDDLVVEQATPTYTVPSRTVAPTGVRAEVYDNAAGGKNLSVYWDAPTDASVASHYVEWSTDAVTWNATRNVGLPGLSTQFQGLTGNTLYARVAAVSFFGRASGWVQTAAGTVAMGYTITTFANLPEGRRQAVVDAAVAAASGQGYSATSVLQALAEYAHFSSFLEGDGCVFSDPDAQVPAVNGSAIASVKGWRFQSPWLLQFDSFKQCTLGADGMLSTGFAGEEYEIFASMDSWSAGEILWVLRADSDPAPSPSTGNVIFQGQQVIHYPWTSGSIIDGLGVGSDQTQRLVADPAPSLADWRIYVSRVTNAGNKAAYLDNAFLGSSTANPVALASGSQLLGAFPGKIMAAAVRSGTSSADSRLKVARFLNEYFNLGKTIS